MHPILIGGVHLSKIRVIFQSKRAAILPRVRFSKSSISENLSLRKNFINIAVLGISTLDYSDIP